MSLLLNLYYMAYLIYIWAEILPHRYNSIFQRLCIVYEFVGLKEVEMDMQKNDKNRVLVDDVPCFNSNRLAMVTSEAHNSVNFRKFRVHNDDQALTLESFHSFAKKP